MNSNPINRTLLIFLFLLNTILVHADRGYIINYETKYMWSGSGKAFNAPYTSDWALAIGDFESDGIPF